MQTARMRTREANRGAVANDVVAEDAFGGLQWRGKTRHGGLQNLPTRAMMGPREYFRWLKTDEA